jgi:hypothetical protein
MGNHARIESGRISIDTLAWLEQRTAGTIDHLTDDLHTWATQTRTSIPGPQHWLELTLGWRRHRGFTGPDPGDPGVIAHTGTRLDADLWIARSITPHDGPIAVIRINDDPPVVHTDHVTDSGDWYDADTVDIGCPNGHGWTWRTGRELLDADGSFTTLTVVFGPNLDAPFSTCPTCQAHQLGQRTEPCGCDGTPWIICPTCGQRCDVELPER